MAALGNCFTPLNSGDVTAVFDLYKATLSVATTADAVTVIEAPGSVNKQQKPCLPWPNEAAGDEAARLHATSIKPVPEEESALFSQEDDSSLDEIPCGDGCITPGELQVDSHFPQ